jgi:transcription elongation factor GreA
VRFGATVVLANAETEEQVTYQILGPYEADIERGSISVTAPLARALMGKEVGDEVTIKRPDGAQRVYEVLEVSFK